MKSELEQAIARAERAEKACAEMRAVLEELPSKYSAALEHECLCGSISSEHGCPFCSAWEKVDRLVTRTISLDCGSGYVQKAELDALKSENARLKEACNKEFADVQRLSDENAKLREALRPFAAVQIKSFGSIPDAEAYLWKPNSSREVLPGISIAHIKIAQTALGTES